MLSFVEYQSAIRRVNIRYVYCHTVLLKAVPVERIQIENTSDIIQHKHAHHYVITPSRSISTISAMSPSSALFSVAGKNVLVTGGSRGIGLMIAKGFAQSGANVLLTSRDEKACSEAASSIDCRYVVSNVATREGCKALAEEASRIFDGKLDVLVNNVSNCLVSCSLLQSRLLCPISMNTTAREQKFSPCFHFS
jgi:hypothetical protein